MDFDYLRFHAQLTADELSQKIIMCLYTRGRCSSNTRNAKTMPTNSRSFIVMSPPGLIPDISLS